MNRPADRLRELAEETGISVDRYVTWFASEPPPGVSREDWLDALTQAAGAPPIPPETVRELQWLIAPGRQAHAA